MLRDPNELYQLELWKCIMEISSEAMDIAFFAEVDTFVFFIFR